MSHWKLVRLNFGQNSVHFGELGIGIEETNERVRSDTLFSALITAYARLFGSDAVSNLLQQFIEKPDRPPFRLSSTFLYQQVGDKTVDYLPKPLRKPSNYPNDDLKFFKTYKKLSYLPVEVWHRWYQEDGFISSGTNSDRDQLIQETTSRSNGNLRKSCLFSYGKGFEKVLVPKIGIDRITRATNLYHTGFIQFNYESKKQSGLYFIIQFTQVNDTLETTVSLCYETDKKLMADIRDASGTFQAPGYEAPKTRRTVADKDGDIKFVPGWVKLTPVL